MKLDPVLAEIRATREAYSERFKCDVGAMLADLRKRQREGGRKVIKLPPKPLPVEASQSASVLEYGNIKESVMQIPVAVEPTGSGGFRAQSVPPFNSVAEGQTSEEAISKVRAELNKEVAAGKRLVLVDVASKEENPWLAMAGWLKDDPLFDEWQAAIKENRRRMDMEDGIEVRERQ